MTAFRGGAMGGGYYSQYKYHCCQRLKKSSIQDYLRIGKQKSKVTFLNEIIQL